MIERAKFSDEEQTVIEVTFSGGTVEFVPADNSNRRYRMVLDWLGEDTRRQIADYVPPPADTTPTLEARIIALEAEVETLKRVRQ